MTTTIDTTLTNRKITTKPIHSERVKGMHGQGEQEALVTTALSMLESRALLEITEPGPHAVKPPAIPDEFRMPLNAFTAEQLREQLEAIDLEQSGHAADVCDSLAGYHEEDAAKSQELANRKRTMAKLARDVHRELQSRAEHITAYLSRQGGR